MFNSKVIITDTNLGAGLAINPITELVDVQISTDTGNKVDRGSDNGIFVSNEVLLPITQNDPVAPANGAMWVLAPLPETNGTIVGFLGAMPVTIESQPEYMLSLKTQDGIKRINL